jgi:hypothetical protein
MKESQKDDEIDRLRRELETAKAEQCPHDYGLLKQMEATFHAESAENVKLRRELVVLAEILRDVARQRGDGSMNGLWCKAIAIIDAYGSKGGGE